MTINSHKDLPFSACSFLLCYFALHPFYLFCLSGRQFSCIVCIHSHIHMHTDVRELFCSLCVVLVTMPSLRLWLLYSLFTSIECRLVHLSMLLLVLAISLPLALRLIVVSFSCLTIRLAQCVCEHAPFSFNSSHLFRLNTLQISGKDFCPFNRCFWDRIEEKASLLAGWLVLLHAIRTNSDVFDSAKVNSIELKALRVPTRVRSVSD